MSSFKPPLVLIVGPTAVGKTEAAIRLAQRVNGEIVSADSRLFYRGMDIGTAKPTPEERRAVPHHLVDVADPDDTWSLSTFQAAAARAIQDIHARGHVPLLAGGTGQYIEAVIHGWQPPVAAPNPRLRAVLEAMAEEHGKDWLHDHLAQIDPAAAAAIDARNLRRSVRALEVILLTGRKFSGQRGSGESPYELITLGLTRPRAELYQRVDTRIEEMFEGGLLDEVRGLLAKGYAASLPSMSAIGYRESVQVIQGTMSLEEAKASMRRQTRVFVRRQANWFKTDDPSIQWYDLSVQGIDEIASDLMRTLQRLSV